MRELRVYGIDISDVELENVGNVSNEQWMDIAEENGLVWSLQGFAEEFNQSMINSETILIRIM
jgi:hypothetical protein